MNIIVTNLDIIHENFDKETLLSFLDVGYYLYKHQISKKVNTLVEKNIDAIVEARVKESEAESLRLLQESCNSELTKLQIENLGLSKRVEEEYEKAKVSFMIDLERKSLTIEHLEKLLKQANDAACKFDSRMEQIYQKMLCDSVQESVKLLKDEVSKKDAEISLLRCSNMVKGNFGEALIADCLRTIFTDAEVINTGKTAHVCDVHMILSSKAKVIIESKYKSCIQKTDIDRFYKDIEGMDSSVIGGVFVSMVTKNIPNKGSINFEITNISYKPLMYVGFENENEFNTYFPSYITMFVKLCEAYTKNTMTDHEVGMLLEEISFYSDVMSKNHKRLEDLKGRFNKYCLEVEDDNKKALCRIANITNRIPTTIVNKKRKGFVCGKCGFACSTQKTLTNHKNKFHPLN